MKVYFDHLWNGIEFRFSYKEAEGLPPHWTDVDFEFNAGSIRHNGEVVGVIPIATFKREALENIRKDAFLTAVSEGVLNEEPSHLLETTSEGCAVHG